MTWIRLALWFAVSGLAGAIEEHYLGKYLGAVTAFATGAVIGVSLREGDR